MSYSPGPDGADRKPYPGVTVPFVVADLPHQVKSLTVDVRQMRIAKCGNLRGRRRDRRGAVRWAGP
eukprot:3351526-Pyramimonas_sp.AAC.1